MTLADQELVIAKDQPCNDVDGWWSAGFHVRLRSIPRRCRPRRARYSFSVIAVRLRFQTTH